MDAKIINPFIRATLEVLKTMAHVNPVAGKPYLKKDDVATGDVSAVIGLTGSKNGAISISFAEKCILRIVTNMFGETMTELDNEIADAVGELANMISGHARRELEEIGIRFDGSIPSVLIGKNHQITHITAGPKIAIPFKIDDTDFTFEVCMET